MTHEERFAARWMVYSIQAQLVTGLLLVFALLFDVVEDISLGLTFGFMLSLFALGLAWFVLLKLQAVPWMMYVALASVFLHEFLALSYTATGTAMGWRFIFMTITGSAFVYIALKQLIGNLYSRAST